MVAFIRRLLETPQPEVEQLTASTEGAGHHSAGGEGDYHSEQQGGEPAQGESEQGETGEDSDHGSESAGEQGRAERGGGGE